MSNQNVRPKWWKLYLTFPLLIVLFAVDIRLKISTRGHQIVQVGIVIFVFGLIRLWLKANTSALSRMDRKQYEGTFTVIEINPNQAIGMEEKSHPLFRLSESEINGVLEDTFDMDNTNSQSFTMEELRKN